MFRLLNKRRAIRSDAGQLYCEIVARARHPALFQHLAVPDTLDGRFDMIVLHGVILLRRLKQLGDHEIAQSVIDTMFEDMDQALRELGVSDVSVAKRIRPMAEAFHGRAAAYNEALDLPEESDALSQAIARNVFPDGDGLSVSERLGEYVRRLERCLAGLETGDMQTGTVAWPEPVKSQ